MKNSAYSFTLLCLAIPFYAASAEPETATSSCFSNPACQPVFQQAKEQSSLGHLDEAVRLYKAAYEVSVDPVLLFNIARVLHKQGQNKEAATCYQQYIDSPIDNAEQKRKARAYLAQLQLSPITPLVSTPAQIDPASITPTSPIENSSINQAFGAISKRTDSYHRAGFILSAIGSAAFYASSVPSWIGVSLEGQTTCGPSVPRNQCPTTYSGNLTPALGLTGLGIALAVPFGILLYLDVKQRRQATLVSAGPHSAPSN